MIFTPMLMPPYAESRQLDTRRAAISIVTPDYATIIDMPRHTAPPPYAAYAIRHACLCATLRGSARATSILSDGWILPR